MAEEALNGAQNTQNEAGAAQTTETNTNSNNLTNEAQNASNEKQSDLEKATQRAVDRATNKLGNENKKLREQIETLKKEKLSDDEIKELEIKNREADIADREAKLKEKENRLFAIKAIKEAGLDDGGNNALELVDFVIGEDEDTITEKVKAFNNLVKKLVSAQVNQTFKANGRTPENGGANSDANSAVNNVAATIGKAAADRDAAANNVLKHYLGGKS